MEDNYGVEVNLSGSLTSSPKSRFLNTSDVSFNEEQFRLLENNDDESRLPYRVNSPPPALDGWMRKSYTSSPNQTPKIAPPPVLDQNHPELALSPTRFSNGETDAETGINKNREKIKKSQIMSQHTRLRVSSYPGLAQNHPESVTSPSRIANKDSLNETELERNQGLLLKSQMSSTQSNTISSLSSTFDQINPGHAMSPTRFSNNDTGAKMQSQTRESSENFLSNNASNKEEELYLPTMEADERVNLYNHGTKQKSGFSILLESLSRTERNPIENDDPSNNSKSNVENRTDDGYSREGQNPYETTKPRKCKTRASKNDGKIRATRSKKKKSQLKAKAKRLQFNCQKVNLTPYSQLECRSDANLEVSNNSDKERILQEFCQTVNDDFDDRSTSSISSIISHEILRANWTWCTAWSPDGSKLAIASENSPLIILDTASKPVWKISYSGRFTPNEKCFSVRAIAWGKDYIAIGGTGDIVTIIDSINYRIRHTINTTGYVGSLSWKYKSNILAIGSRLDRFFLVRIIARNSNVKSEIISTVKRDDWVNTVCFSPRGCLIAMGDKKGTASVYSLNESRHEVILKRVTDYFLEDSILFTTWSSDGKWLFMGGEDYGITIIDTGTWNVVNQLRRDQWVFSAACSNRGSHFAAGGADAQINLFQVGQWNHGKSIELNGNVVLDAQWHPEDKYLSLAGQDGTVKVVDIMKSHQAYKQCMRFGTGIQSLDVSSDGKYLAVGKDDGVASIVERTSSPKVIYEIVLACDMSNNQMSIQWSPDNRLVAVGAKDQVILLKALQSNDDPSVQHSRFSVCKILRDLDEVDSISFSPNSKYMIVSGTIPRVFNVENNFICEKEFLQKSVSGSSWSPDGSFLALIGRDKTLKIFDTRNNSCDWWRLMFDLACDGDVEALSWGPSLSGKLNYLAYGGADQKVTVIQIRLIEECWEVALVLPYLGTVLNMHWRRDGILAVGCNNGTANVVDLNYLLSGRAVHEMDYKWQRQGITSSVLIQRKTRNNGINVVKWLSRNATENHVLVLSGSDGIIETINFA